MIFKHSSIYLIARLVPGLMAFTALSIYSHLLSPSEYGTYTLIITGAYFIHNTLFQWLASGALRFWSNTTYSSRQIITTLGINHIKLSASLLVTSVVIYLYYRGQPVATWVINSYFLIQALALLSITQYIFMARIMPTSYAFITILYALLALLLGASLAHMGYGVSGVLLGITLGAVLPALWVFKKTWGLFDRASYSKPLFMDFVSYGFPLASGYFLEEVTKLTDRFMLAGMLDKSQAGFYGIAYDLSGNSIFMIMTAINMAAYPVIIKLLETDGKEAAIKQFRVYVIFLLGFSLPAVVGLNFVGPGLVNLIIDKAYIEPITLLLPWITTAIFMVGIQAFYFNLAFQLGHKVIFIVRISILITLLNIVLNYFLIPEFGLKGAATAILASYTISSSISAYFSKEAFPLSFPISDIVKIVISTFVMGLCLWWLRDLEGWSGFFLQLLAGVVSYTILIIFVNVLDVRSKLKTIFMNMKNSRN